MRTILGLLLATPSNSLRHRPIDISTMMHALNTKLNAFARGEEASRGLRGSLALPRTFSSAA
jgi:hypothetical protein